MQADDSVLAEIEAHAIELAKGSGRILESQFGSVIDVQFKSKDRSDPVSKADVESEEYLRNAIKKRFPDHGILGEEGTSQDAGPSGFVWVLDPLDGTVNYINGLPIYSVSVGVLHRGAPVVGCIWVPWPGKSQGLVYNARKGHGAFLNGTSISVSKNTTPQPGQLSIFHREFRLMYHRNAGGKSPTGEGRGPGSLAYEMALTSNGVFQFAVFSSPRIWDVVAGVVLVQEAGGEALTFDRRRRRWEKLTRFSVSSGPAPDGTAELRSWVAPVMAGNGEMVDYLAESMRPGRLRWPFGRLLGRRG